MKRNAVPGLKASRFRELFGENNLLCVPPERAHLLGLEAEAVDAMSRFGLPKEFSEVSLRFSLELSPLPLHSQDGFEFLILGSENDFSAEALYRSIGKAPDEPYAWLCINLQDQAIYSVSNDVMQAVCLINTSMVTFLECLYEFRHASLHVEEIDDDELLLELTEQLEQNLKTIDPRGFASNENWWPSVFASLL